MTQHLDITVNRSLKILGFIKRNLYNFNNIYCIKTVYSSFVRSILEYCTIIWSPVYQTQINKIERVQNKFLRFASYKLQIPVEDINYEVIRNLINLAELSCRTKEAGQLFLYKLLNNMLNAPEILARVNFNVPLRVTRQKHLFYVHSHTTNYGLTCPMSRICSEANILNIDYFNVSLSKFKSNLKSLLYT